MSAFNAEAGLLGAVLLDAPTYWHVADLVTAQDFTRAEYAELWDAVASLARRNVAVDAITLGEQIPELAGLAVEVVNATPGTANVRNYAEIVAADALCRRVRSAGRLIQALPAWDALGEAQKILQGCAGPSRGNVKHVRDFMRESVARMQTRVDATSELSGIPFGLPKLDWATCGAQAGDMIILAARPSVGKTAVALQFALHAVQHGHPALFISLEMAGVQLTDRALAHLSGIDSNLIRQPKRMQDHEWPQVTDAGQRLGSLPLRIDDSSAPTIEQLCARIRQCHACEPVELVVIDYLSYITPPRANSTNDGIQIITRQLKALAKTLRIPILLLCQLNRDLHGRPTLANLRDSGAIEQDADVVLFLHRPDDSKRERLELLIAKQRNGPLADIQLYADLQCQRFSQMEWEADPAPARGFRSRVDVRKLRGGDES